MEDIRIYCENSQSYMSVPMGITLKEVSRTLGGLEFNDENPLLAALVDNKLKSLDYKVINPHNVRFVGYDHPDGRRTYIRSLCFVLQKVVRDMYPAKVLAIDYSLPSGLYCEIREAEPMEDGRPKVFFVTDDELQTIEDKMQSLIDADQPFGKKMLSLKECEALFTHNGQTEKVNLLKIGFFLY